MTQQPATLHLPPEEVILVYTDDHGNQHTQPAADLVEAGTLIDPEDGRDMEITEVMINITHGRAGAIY